MAAACFDRAVGWASPEPCSNMMSLCFPFDLLFASQDQRQTRGIIHSYVLRLLMQSKFRCPPSIAPLPVRLLYLVWTQRFRGVCTVRSLR
eukprot:3952431-Karenia_brevis.AAC.1